MKYPRINFAIQIVLPWSCPTDMVFSRLAPYPSRANGVNQPCDKKSVPTAGKTNIHGYKPHPQQCAQLKWD